MNYLKYRSAFRFYYEDNKMFFVSHNQKFTIKIDEEEYVKIHRMLGVFADGLEEKQAYEAYPQYKKIIDFLRKIGMIYSIDLALLRKHQDKLYYPIIETQSNSITDDLSVIEACTVEIREDFLAATEIAKLCDMNNLSYRLLKHNEEDLVVSINNSRIKVINNVLNANNEIIIAPKEKGKLLYMGEKSVSRDKITPKLLSKFNFYSLIEAIISREEESVFLINDELEVKKKKWFNFNSFNTKEQLKEELSDSDSIKSLNALEIFLDTYCSRIQSFNGNPEYGIYNQLPLQVFTIQYYSTDNKLENMYLADLNYERLSKYVTEVVFAEVLRESYGNHYTILQNEKIIHDTVNSYTNKVVKKVELEELEEFETIQELLAERNIAVHTSIELQDDGKYRIRITDQQLDKVYQYKIPIYQLEYIPGVIYTFISSIENGIELEKAGFFELELINQRRINGDYGNAEHNVNVLNRNDISWNHTNISSILKEIGFAYNVWEMRA
ncbi:hypothetical protein COE65_21905 [Bacillus sp. AFS051223]|uniref:hypothetical protein n=1 Tax=Bacillus sp. AFS051223 TaxID=2034280 RepID=UPI000BFB82CF|nr:hypothetical protein [Bacillus sp. AFS051223]PHA07855.1 hypothetical protein COE65_21905 [Bacillus sp. AFS051223]